MNHKNTTKYGIMAAAVLFSIIGGTSLSQHVDAYQNYQHYSNGWDVGQSDAQSAWINHYNYDPLSWQCNGHSHDYCQGYHDGYNEYWTRANAQNVDSNNNVAENNANIKVNGNNNHVEINQNNGQNSGTDSSSGDNSPY